MATKSTTERALQYLRNAPRIKLDDLRDNPGARTQGRLVTKYSNRAGKGLFTLSSAAKPPLGWIWGDFYKPWQRLYPGETHFNMDINLRREYPPVSLLELQRLIDLGWIDPDWPIDLTALCNTGRYKCDPKLRQFGVQLTDEGADIFSSRVNLEVQWASETAVAAVEKAGGVITVAYYDPFSLTAAVDPIAWFQQGEPIPRRRPPPADLMSYYTNPASRGYLASIASRSTARVDLALKMGHLLPELDDTSPTLTMKKDPLQVFFGLTPGWVVNLSEKTILKPTDPSLLAYYNGGTDLKADD